MTDHPKHAEATEPVPRPRRNFLVELAAMATGAVVALLPVIGGAVLVLNPLIRRRPSGTAGDAADGFVKIGMTGSLTPQGPPQQFKVAGSKQDAWTTYPEAALGAVYVRMQEDGSLQCFNARCPHLGCMVSFKSAAGEYVCPCHDSSFDLAGARSNDIPPRNMDPLECEIRNGNEIWVRFQNFRAGTAERIPV